MSDLVIDDKLIDRIKSLNVGITKDKFLWIKLVDTLIPEHVELVTTKIDELLKSLNISGIFSVRSIDDIEVMSDDQLSLLGLQRVNK